MKYYISQETGSAYWLYHDALMYAPLNADNTFDPNEGSQVDTDLVGLEQVGKQTVDNDRILNDVYREAREALVAA